MLTVDQRIAEVAKALIDGGSDFLFGAGMSAEAGVASGQGLALGLLRRLFPDKDSIPDAELERLAHGTPLPAIAEAVARNSGESRPPRAKATTGILAFDEEHASLSNAHHDFAEICRIAGPTAVRRVFDHRTPTDLEQALGNSAKPVTEKNTTDYENALIDGDIPIVYLHGLLRDDHEFLNYGRGLRRHRSASNREHYPPHSINWKL
ncbi:MAG: hypothetical protein U5R31_16540 [Acidimicrobiia bacterium]|nr:hypothetical protein [Acidimicrobiia bacterium]